jgi:aerotaxis receptor
MNRVSVSNGVLIDEPRPFKLEEVFFSTTDVKGRIIAGNDVFVRISGYSQSELTGQAHSIIRHPDMPRGVFRLLWDYIQSGRSIAAYVKNLAKDGRYYWVMALVSANSGGYLSVRFKPTSPLLDKVEKLYKEMLAVEREIESQGNGDKEKAITASQCLLLETLKKLGFQNYEEFMRIAFLAEIREREKVMAKSTPSGSNASQTPELERLSISDFSRSCEDTGVAANQLFRHMDKITSIENVVGSIEKYITDSAVTMKFLSLNASIESTILGSSAGSVTTVTEWLNISLKEALAETSTLSHLFVRVVGDLRSAMFELGCAKLQVEIIKSYLDSVSGLSDSSEVASRDDILNLIRDLCATMVEKMNHAFKRLELLPEASSQLLKGLALIDKQQSTLRFLNVAGKVEIARIANRKSLSDVFDQVGRLIERTNNELLMLQQAVNDMQNVMIFSVKPQQTVARAVEKMTLLSHSLVGLA